MLRRLDMPLAQVAEIVSAPDAERADLVASYWETVERRVASQRQLAAHLRIRLAGGEGRFDMYEIQEREVPEQLVLTEQRHVRVPELSQWLPEAIDRLVETAEERGGPAGDVFVVYHGEVNEDSDGPVEVCVPVGAGARRRRRADAPRARRTGRRTPGSRRPRSSTRRSCRPTTRWRSGSARKDARHGLAAGGLLRRLRRRGADRRGVRHRVPGGVGARGGGLAKKKKKKKKSSARTRPTRGRLFAVPRDGAYRLTGTPFGSRNCAYR